MLNQIVLQTGLLMGFHLGHPGRVDILPSKELNRSPFLNDSVIDKVCLLQMTFLNAVIC